MKILTDLHTHTSASTHSYSSLLENAKCAAEKGLELIAMTNHGPAIEDGAHAFHFNNMDVLPDEIYGVRILRGIEANALDINGNLDIPSTALSKPCLDLVIASCHSPFLDYDKVFQPSSESEFVQLYENFARNSLIDIMGHMNRTEFMSNLDYVIPMLQKNNKVIEINPHCAKEKWRQGLFVLIDACLKHKARITVCSDAHFCLGIGDFRGIDDYLTEIGYSEELVVNRNMESVLNWLSERNR